MAAGSKHEPSTAKHRRFPWPSLLILAEAVLLIARLVLLYRPGLIFTGSICSRLPRLSIAVTTTTALMRVGLLASRH